MRPEYDVVYGAVLRTLAWERRVARLGAQIVDADWESIPEEIIELQTPESYRIGRLLAMSRHVREFAQKTDEELSMWPHQVAPFKQLLEFLDFEKAGPQGVRNVYDGGFLRLPPGHGKTVQIVRAAQAVGTGENLCGAEYGPKVRSLVLVPSRRIKKQMVGIELPPEELDDEPDNDDYSFEGQDDAGSSVMGGFGEFAPDLKIVMFQSGHNTKKMDYDVLVMTYHGFRMAYQRGAISKDDVDIIFADEAHHLMGEQTQAACRSFTQGEIPVIGFTASDRYSEDRLLSSVLPHKICEVDFRSQIVDEGVLPPMQLIAVSTPNLIMARRSGGEFSESELASLVHNEDRNNHIIDWIKHFTSEGRHVFVPCIRGNDCEHSQILANAASQQKIYDERIDEYRDLVARCVKSTMTQGEINAVLEEWSQGKVDVLFTTAMLGEGWSSSLVDVVVDAAPTTSRVVSEQRVGRLTRHNEKWPVKVYVSLIDRVKGGKRLYTPWDVLEEDKMNSWVVIGEGASRRVGAQRKAITRSKVTAKQLPPALGRRIMEDYTVVDEALLAVDADRRKPPKEGFVPLADYKEVWHGMDLSGVTVVLNRHGFNVEVALGRKGPMRHVHESGIDFLKTYVPPPFQPPGAKTLTDISKLLGVSIKRVNTLAGELGLEAQLFKSRKNKYVYEYYVKEDVEALLNRHDEMTTFEPGDQAVSEIADTYGFGVTSMNLRMLQFDPPIQSIVKTLPSGQDGLVVSAADAAKLHESIQEALITKDNGRETIKTLGMKSGKSRNVVRAAIAKAGIDSNNLPRGLYHNEETGYEQSKYLEPEQAAMVLRILGVKPPSNTKAARKEPIKRKKSTLAVVSNESIKQTTKSGLSWRPIHELVDAFNGTQQALRLILAQQDKSLFQSSEGALQDIRSDALGRILTTHYGMAPVDWVSHESLLSFAAYKGVAMPRPYLSRRDYGIYSGGSGIIDVYYSPSGARSMQDNINSIHLRKRNKEEREEDD